MLNILFALTLHCFFPDNYGTLSDCSTFLSILHKNENRLWQWNNMSSSFIQQFRKVHTCLVLNLLWIILLVKDM